MATIFWTSGGSTDFEDAANYSGAALPTTSDTLVMTSSKSNIAIDGVKTTVVPGKMFVDESYTAATGGAKIGESGQSLEFDGANVTDLAIFGRCANGIFIGCDTGDTITNTVVRTSSQGTDAVHLTGAGTFTNTHVLMGRVTLETGPTFTNIQCAYANSRAADANLTIQSGATTPTINQAGGTVSLGAACTTYTMAGGFSTVTDGDITTVNLHGGARMVYESDGHTITKLNGFDGTLDLSTLSVLRTVTNADLYKNGFIDLRSGAAEDVVTLTNNPKSFGNPQALLQSASSFPVDYY